MNDLATITNAPEMILFADDTNFLYSNQNFNALIQEINLSLRNISNWFANNELSLNIEKTNFLLFHSQGQNIAHLDFTIKINNEQISQQNNLKFLGIDLDSNMNWKSHLNKKASQIARVNGVLCRLKHQLPPHILKIIYETLILPHITYGITAWGNVNSVALQRIMTLQKKSIRLITKSKYNCHTEPLFQKTRLLKVENIFQLNCCKIYHKLIKGHLPQYFLSQLQTNCIIHSHNTRQHDHIHTKNITKVLLKQSINFKISTAWNLLPEEIREQTFLTTYCFNKKIKNYFLANYSSICDDKNCYVCERI
jgi:hypothetical protein